MSKEKKEKKDKKNAPTEETEITENQLAIIKNEIYNTRHYIKMKRSPIYTMIFKNLLLAIFIIIYLYILIVGYEAIGFKNYFSAIKIIDLVLAGIGLILLEVGYNTQNGKTFIHGFEIIGVGAMTLVLVNLFIRHNTRISLYEVISVVVVTLYFLIKSLVIGIKETRKRNKIKQEIKNIGFED